MKKVLVSLVCVFMVLAMMPAMAFANTSLILWSTIMTMTLVAGTTMLIKNRKEREEGAKCY